MTHDSHMVYPRHRDVRIGEPREPALLLQPRLLLVHSVVHPATPSFWGRAGPQTSPQTSCCEVARPGFKVLVRHLLIAVYFFAGARARVLVSRSLRWFGLQLALAHGLSFHSGAMRRVRGRGIFTVVFASGRPHWRGSFNFHGHQPRNWQRSPGRPLPSAVSCRLTRLTSRREFAGLSVWQPHAKVNRQKGETVFGSWWTLLWCLWRPPSLPEWFSFVVSSFLGTGSATW